MIAEGHHHHAGIGELRLGKADDVLNANLGSCVGIAIGWAQAGKMGLVHVLLPAPEDLSDIRYTRYASTAVDHVLRRMRVPKDRVGELRAVIAGGAAMYGENGGVGAENIREGLAALRRARVRLIGKDVGGLKGRRLVVDCATRKVTSILLTNPREKEIWTIPLKK
ncbi:MAG: chemotaxis protein CheD [Myxococcota bacterium]